MENVENLGRLRTQIERQQALIEALTRLRANDYVPWQGAGGPNECLHGRAKGIACPLCDRNTELDALGEKVVASEWETSAHALEAETFRKEWVRKRVEAWADRDMESLGAWFSKTATGDDFKRRGSALEGAELVWRLAGELYEAGKRLGFLP